MFNGILYLSSTKHLQAEIHNLQKLVDLFDKNK